MTKRALRFGVNPVSRVRAFTMVEVLVSATLLIVIIMIVLQITNQTSALWRSSNARIQAFQEARAGFESMTRRLSQATLNTYFDYYNTANESRSQKTSAADLASFVPARYDRASDLHFITGQAQPLLAGAMTLKNNPIQTQTQAVFFQAPLGYSVLYSKLERGLNACGYYLQFDDAEDATMPGYVQADWPGYRLRYRFRLMEMIQPTENLSVYGTLATPRDWFVTNLALNSRILSENVIALALLPKVSPREDDPSKPGKGVSIAPNFDYDSRVAVASTGDTFKMYPSDNTIVDASRHHQLPPLIRVVMVVIDEASASRLQGTATTIPSAIDLRNTGLFTDAADLDADISQVESVCNADANNLTGNKQKLTYRVFSTDIILREAKWSND